MHRGRGRLVRRLAARPTRGPSRRERAKPAKPATKAATAGSRLGSTSAVPAGKWMGQDGHDVVGPSTAIAPSDVQDIHIALAGLPAERGDHLRRRSAGWAAESGSTRGRTGRGAAQIEREQGSPSADCTSSRRRSRAGGRSRSLLQFEDGRKAEFDRRGRAGRSQPADGRGGHDGAVDRAGARSTGSGTGHPSARTGFTTRRSRWRGSRRRWRSRAWSSTDRAGRSGIRA